MNALDSMYKILIKQNGVTGKINNVDCKFLLTECQDSNTNGLDVLTISTDQPLEQGYFVNIGTDTFLVIDKKTETKAYQSYNIGTIQKTNHLNKFVSSEVIYECPSICTNITKGKLGMIYQSAGITEAQGVWCFITQQNDMTKKIGTGTRFIINGDAWKCTSLDRVTDEGILYVILRLDPINMEIDDLINEVAGGLAIPNYAITLNSTSQSLYSGYTVQIVPTCTKNSVADTSAVVTYLSSNPNVASVNSSGLVTAQSTLGSATISATYKGKIATMTINVIADVYSIDLSSNSASIFVDETYQINSVCKKNNVVVSNPVVTYVSDNTSIANVDSNGLISAVGQGSCNIVCSYGNVTATFNLTTNANVYEITLGSTSENIIQGGTYAINPICKKNSIEVTSPLVSYSSSNESIATVSATGEVTTLAVGNVDITCNFHGVNAILKIVVNPVPVVHTYTIAMDSTGSIIQGNTLQLAPVCKDNDVTVTNPIVVYSSSDNSIAAIDSTGLINSVNIGNCVITATFEGVNALMNLEVKEKPHVYTIALDSATQSIEVGNTHEIISTCTDDGTTVSSPVVTYTSSDNAIATVSTTGLITTVSKGSCTITATYENVSSILSLTVTGVPVVAYTSTWSNSNGTLLRLMSSTTATYVKTLDNVADTSLVVNYTGDATFNSLLSQKKISITKTSNTTFNVKNTNTTTAMSVVITFTDASNGKVIEVKTIALKGV